jgi:tRNA pseudouridine38-40 synthase
LNKKYFIQLSYKGTRYHGWQVQPNAVTVQEILNDKLSILLCETVETIGAGRTDTGVHARFFVADFVTANLNMEEKQKFIYKLNSMLPHDMAVMDIQEVSLESNARFDAVSRMYKYYLSDKKLPFIEDYYYKIFPLPNIERMNEACSILYGASDFTSFSKLHTQTKTNNCKLSKAIWETQDELMVFTIVADRFLRNMVRSIVGTLVEIGLGNLSIPDLQKIIDSKDRSNAGYSVPAKGLVLYDIEYDEEIFKKNTQNQNKSFIKLV